MGLGVAFNEQSNQAQERLMLGISPSAQKCPDLDIGQVTSRWGIRLMPDKYFPGARITAEKPPISIRAAVKLSYLRWHAVPRSASATGTKCVLAVCVVIRQ